jgi:hypothetical protein
MMQFAAFDDKVGMNKRNHLVECALEKSSGEAHRDGCGQQDQVRVQKSAAYRGAVVALAALAGGAGPTVPAACAAIQLELGKIEPGYRMTDGVKATGESAQIGVKRRSRVRFTVQDDNAHNVSPFVQSQHFYNVEMIA